MYLFIYYTCLWSVYFGRVSLWRFLWRARSYFFLCGAPLCGMSVRYNLFEGWPGVGGGAVQVFLLFGLCCGEYGTIYFNAGRGWAAGLYRFSSGIICWSCVL